jgi:hypothetical protein
MAGESSKETREEQVESLIDDLIRDIFNESGGPSEFSAMRGMGTTAALFETALGSSKSATRTSMLERVIVAQFFASELAEALAPALAEQLAPRLLKSLEESMASQAAGKKPPQPSASRSSGQARKADAK